MKSLTLAGVTLDVLEADWNLNAKPAALVVRARNSREHLERLTGALRNDMEPKLQVGELAITVRVLSLFTDVHKITLHLSRIEKAPLKTAA